MTICHKWKIPSIELMLGHRNKNVFNIYIISFYLLLKHYEVEKHNIVEQEKLFFFIHLKYLTNKAACIIK